jgi:hypothetical protein
MAPLLGQALRNSPVDCFSEGASRRGGIGGVAPMQSVTGWSLIYFNLHPFYLVMPTKEGPHQLEQA